MALAYPNMITTVGDIAHPSWRGGALGVYRLWHDAGYAIGPLVLGAMATTAGLAAAMWTAAGLLAASGIVLVALLRETQPGRCTREPAWETHREWVAS